MAHSLTCWYKENVQSKSPVDGFGQLPNPKHPQWDSQWLTLKISSTRVTSHPGEKILMNKDEEVSDCVRPATTHIRMTV